MAQYRINFGKNLGWRGRVAVVLATAVGLAAAVALVILSLGLFIILVPVVAVAYVIGRWRLRKLMDEAARQQRSGEQRTIEIDYKVIDRNDPRR